MKTVILKKQYRGYPKGTELTFIVDSQADVLIADDIAIQKDILQAPKDKMVRGNKRK